MNLSNALLLSIAAAVAASHPSIRGGSDGGDELHRRLIFFTPPPSCGGNPPVNPLYQPCCGEPPCWCDLDADSSSGSGSSSGDINTCPLYPSRGIYNLQGFPGSSSPDIIEFFASLDLIDGCETPKICQPDLKSSVNLEGNSISPGILNAILPGEPPCDKVRGNRVCGIQFENGGVISPSGYVPDCNPSTSMRATHYKVKTFRNKNQLNRAGYFVLHEGDCGACSTAADLATYMEYSFPRGPIFLPFVGALPPDGPGDLVEKISECLQGKPGYPTTNPQLFPTGFSFTPDCAKAWAVNTFFTGLPNVAGGCFEDCDALTRGDDPYDVETCELHPCLRCDDSVNGDLFEQLAGMTRRGAGLHTVIPRPCGSLAGVTHSCVAKMMPI